MRHSGLVLVAVQKNTAWRSFLLQAPADQERKHDLVLAMLSRSIIKKSASSIGHRHLCCRWVQEATADHTSMKCTAS